MCYGEFFDENEANYKLIIFLLTDGTPEDSKKDVLCLFNNNMHFNNAIKIGIAIGLSADVEFLSVFTNSEKHIISTVTPNDFLKRIVFDDLNK